MAHQNTEIASKKQEDDDPKALKKILSMLPKIEFNLPFFNQKPKKPGTVNETPKTTLDSGGSSSSSGGAGDASETKKVSLKPNLARFPDSIGPRIPPPLDFEAEEPAGRTSNPIVLWQVYALGGFLVLRWVWARWKERKERDAKNDSSDDNSNEPPPPPPADDDDYHSA
ncbi:hypothetical protein EZV62_025250 [Acer yangbiense]|uniref:Uncharacterized protein n=1 Tax=Acer yangbiense TaxID=1000413 RepID=A0A5C7GY10_9ROSI|nr:hypothetical protein EZV62_025250 [Acer yangbiense]